MRPEDNSYHGRADRPAAAPPERLAAADVMTGREVAALLHAPVSTVEDWARRNILPSVKIGRRRLYIRQNIEAVLTSHTPKH
jgi:excisionase family DNA binding protein